METDSRRSFRRCALPARLPESQFLDLLFRRSLPRNAIYVLDGRVFNGGSRRQEMETLGQEIGLAATVSLVQPSADRVKRRFCDDACAESTGTENYHDLGHSGQRLVARASRKSESR